MNRLLSIAVLALAPPMPARADPPAPPQDRQCWLDAMTDAQKRELVQGYIAVQNSEGKDRANAWVRQQKVLREKQAAASGICPAPDGAATPQPSPGEPEPQILNRDGKPCKRIELENQNVPNLGGAMGWALIPVCKD